VRIAGRNTQGVRIMSLEEGDTLAAIVCVPREEREEGDGEALGREDGGATRDQVAVQIVQKPAVRQRLRRRAPDQSGRLEVSLYSPLWLCS
jgi:hypothetical protein